MENWPDPFKGSRYLHPTNPFLPFTKHAVDQSLPDRFEQQVKLYPEQIALKHKGRAISYRGLNGKANRIAQSLLQVCNDEQQRIALLLENGEAIIAAILGVLKSGNVYVPLDPSLPRVRTEFIVQDSQAELMLTDTGNLPLAQEVRDGTTRLINIDDLDSSLSAEDVALNIPPDALAYIVYTSGSTGQPKGVMETHRNLLHNVMRNTNVLHISTQDRVSLLRSIGAAGAARDALSALLNGATLCPFSVKQDGLGTLAGWLAQERITIFTSVITVFRHFVATLSGNEQFDELRLIYLGGEQVTTKDVEFYQKHFSSDCLFVNRLGVSETGTIAYYFIDKKTPLMGGVVPVGYAAEDIEIMLLDEEGNEVAAGAVGEISVKSRYLSPGYWRNPELTRSAFLPDPKGEDKRIYRTGDLGRKLPDGCLVHLGWKDLQVNIRGHRIEVAEVETALLKHPGVKEVAVIGREHWSGEVRLVAACVPRRDAVLSSDDLRKFLKNRLPDFMIPSAFTLLHALPLGPNGKVDRRALPAPDWLPEQAADSHIAARTELEEFIAGLWREVLGLERVGIHDNFFDLGGHSLLLGQIVSKLQAGFKIDVALGHFFQQPTVTGLAENVRRAFGVQRGFEAAIAAVSRPDGFPLSFGQERLWFLHQLEPDTAAYNIPTATLIEGRLDIEALDKALNEVVKRHAALRTTFTLANGQPAQVILPDLRLALPVMDISNLSEAESEAEARRLIVEHTQRPFDLAAGPLLEVMLLKLSDEKQIFVTVHHLVADAWSIGILFKETSIFYNTYTGGTPSTLSTLPVQYTDFTLWQREGLQGNALKSLISYWKRQLGDGLSSSTELPTDRPRPLLQSFRGARQSVALSETLTAAIKGLSRGCSATLFMTLLAAFKTLLYRYTGQESVVVGSPVAGRNRAEVHDLIGLFVNTLVLRTDFSGNPSFRELLGRVRETCLGAYAHQDLPFEKLVEELQPERDLSRNPLFQVMFVFQNTPLSVVDFIGLTARRLEVDNGTAKFDLTLSLAEQDRKLIGFLEYSTDLFDGATIQRMVGHFEKLLEGIVADPEQSISTLPLLTEAERQQLLVSWNDTESQYPRDACIHQLFEAQAARSAESVAVEFEGKRLTYGELNRRANQLGHYLRKLGVGPEQLVGICVERSVEMVVGLLGILKAGGGYVPLDPAYPRERLAFMLQDAQVSVLLTQEAIAQRHWGSAMSSEETLTILCVDRDWQEIGKESEENVVSNAHADNLAYVIYTSGSTGIPKGVQITHRSLVNCVWSMQQQFGLTQEDRWVALTTLSFDIAGLEIYLPLVSGAVVVLASREEALDGKLLAGRLTESEATVMQATPSGWKLLLDGGWRGGGGFKILSGGEALSWALADRLLDGATSLWNLYGPTETTIWSTIGKIQVGEGTVSIGRPIANSQIYILDSRLQPVSVGVQGELYIGGEGLARGYLKRAELTAEKFVPQPFSDEPGSRLYRTGDIARYRRDGSIEFVGRVDQQVKIRGYRIELGEIEAALNLHPAVKENVVVFRERGSSGAKDLIGYVVSKEPSAPSVTALRSFLKEKLPEYMIPTQFVILDALPLTANGKVNRRQLPVSDEAKLQLSEPFIAPRTQTEELIAQVWKDVLKVENIGVHDNFFDLGGHSLLVAQVLASVRDILQKDVPLREFFEAPTIEGVAIAVEKAGVGKRKIGFPSMVRVPRREACPLSSSQKQLWILDQLLPGTFFLNMPYAYRLNGRLDVKVLRNALQEVIRRHEAFHMIFGVRKGRPVQFVGKVPEIELPIADLRRLPSNERDKEFERLSKDDAGLPFDLEEGPLIRVQLVRFGEEEHILLVTVHHIICDNWSLQVFRQELTILYKEYSQGRPSPLPEVSIQFIDFVCWQREALKRGFLKEQLAYWKKRLSGRVPTLEFQKHRRRQRKLSFRTSTQLIELGTTTLRGLRTLASREHSTSFIFLLAVLDLVLYRHTREQDIWVGTTVANRSQIGAQNVIGNCLNAVILRTRIFPELTFTQFLRQVRDISIAAMMHQDLPFGQVARAVAKANDRLRDAPLFQVMFIYQKRTVQSIKLPGLTIASWDGGYRRPKQNVLLTRLNLIFEVRESSTKLTASVNYKTHEVGDQVASQIAKNFQEVAERVLHDPNQKLRDAIDSV